MSETLKRQWVPVAGGSCDIRMGFGALDQASKLMSDSVGHPRSCMVVARRSASDDIVELLRRQLVNAGFSVSWHLVEEENARTISQAERLCNALANEHITGDDLCCALGDADLLSMVSYVCGSWCSGMPFVAVTQDEIALLEGALVPRSLDVGKYSRMVSVKASANHALLDYDLCMSEHGSETSLYVRAIMVATAMASSERVFSELWDSAESIASGDEAVLLDQLLATARARGQAVSSSAAAIRQAMDYGQSFANALGCITNNRLPRSVCMGEAMRFCARISVALEKLPVDDMLAQDELLQTLGIGFATCNIEPQTLLEALKEEHFRRGNRFMLLVPFAIGRVRLTSVPDDMLVEHAQAWCAAHR